MSFDKFEIWCEPSRCVIICSGIYYYRLKTQHIININNVLFWIFLCRGIAYLEKCTSWGFTRIECREKCLDLRRIRWPNVGLRCFTRKIANFYSTPNVIRLIDSRGWQEEKMHSEFGWASLKKEPTWKLTHRFEDVIKMNCKEIGWQDMDWIRVAGDREKWYSKTCLKRTLY